jgi:hypothetical protein
MKNKMKKINPILIASILLLGAPAKAESPVGSYNSESSVKSGVTVAWFGSDFTKAANDETRRETKKSKNSKKQKKLDAKKKAKKLKKKKKKARKKKEKAFTDGELRERAIKEYHKRRKWR